MQFSTAESVMSLSKLKLTFFHLGKILKVIRMPLRRADAAMQLHVPYQQWVLKVNSNIF